ncbi:TetR/AcrR family transcriptional regulator [Pseudomonas sp. NPDC088368]|uniref:TetR/AcrR family transcriptional regulator n=1 Tax=Pseudomonas sp. NPDC088368 TaxID=3364453 RepID=UPI00380E5B84
MAQMGRPRTFDRARAIDEAMLLFWEHGYDSTSLSQLKAGIGGGITAPSFYAAFGSKEGLFNEVVARYLDTHGRVMDPVFDRHLTPRDAIVTALKSSARMQCADDHPKGCMVALGTMGACAPASAGVREPLDVARARNRAGLRACIERAVFEGGLPPETEVIEMAAVFESFLLGISTMARDGIALGVIEGAIDRLMHVWDAQATDGQSEKA